MEFLFVIVLDIPQQVLVDKTDAPPGSEPAGDNEAWATFQVSTLETIHLIQNRMVCA